MINTARSGTARLLGTVFLTIFLLGLSHVSYGSLASSFFIGCEFTLSDGKTVRGYFQTWDDGEYIALQPGTVAAPSGLTLRDKPSVKGNKIMTLKRDAQVIVLDSTGEEETIEGKKSCWFRVRVGKDEGYAFGGFMQMTPPGETPLPFIYAPFEDGKRIPELPVDGKFVMEKFVRSGSPEGAEPDDPEYRQLEVHPEIFSLDYFPRSDDRIFTDCEGRIARSGFLASDTIKVEKSLIKDVRVFGCRTGNVPPLLSLVPDELELLRKPAEAMFTVEEYPAGVVSLISYNKEYSSPKALENLLRKFVSGRKANEEDGAKEWWAPIYSGEEEFREYVLPDDVLLFIYHVAD